MLSQDLENIELIIFDTETTGLEPESGDRIVEIAAIKFKGGQRIGTFQSLVNPRRSISPGAFRVNNITQEMLKGAPPIEKVLPDFLNFIRETCLCSYNAAFDMEFLNSELRRCGEEALGGAMVVDILKMARRLMPGLERYALWFVADRLGVVTPQKHRASQDAELTLEVFNRLKAILKAKGIVGFSNFLSLFGINGRFLQSINNQKIAKIQEAIGLGVKLKIRYLSSSGVQVSEREIMPKQIKQDKNRSYLIAKCFLRQEERTFNIDGILHLEIV